MAESQEIVRYKLEGEVLEEVKARSEEIDKLTAKYKELRKELNYITTITEAENAKLWKFIGQHYPNTNSLPSHVDKKTWELVIGEKDDIDGMSFFQRLLGI